MRQEGLEAAVPPQRGPGKLGQTGEGLGDGDLPASSAGHCLGHHNPEGAVSPQDANRRRKPHSSAML